MAHDVFISYTRPERDLVTSIATALERAGVTTWWDGLLIPGEPFDRQIQSVLAGSKVIVGVLSKEALASEWVRWELSQASQNGLHVLPILLNGARPEHLPPPLHLLHALMLPVGEPKEAIDDVAGQVARVVSRVRTNSAKPVRPMDVHRASEARRRLASAAAETARRAAGIKGRNRRNGPPPTIQIDAPTDLGAGSDDAVDYAASDGFVDFLGQQDVSIAFTSFQAGQLFMLGRHPKGGMMVHKEAHRKAMGLHVSDGTLVLATLAHLLKLESPLGVGQRVNCYSHCYVPRVSYFTGLVDAHDVGMAQGGRILSVNTRYNCLGEASPRHSYRPIWKPEFITKIVAEDRCHLNGLAMDDGTPAFVTAVSRTDEFDAWRDHVADGGLVIDIRHDRVVCEGLSMPHSPRVHEGRLWVLNSGTGELGWVGTARTGRFQALAFCPGFVRGLTFHGAYAVVGVSRPRYGTFEGLALDGRLRQAGVEAWCGIQIIDTRTGECVHWFRVGESIAEIYDVAVLPGVQCPRSVGLFSEDAFDLITLET